MSVKSFEEKLREREAEIRKIWASQSKAKVVVPTTIAAVSSTSSVSIEQDMEQESNELCITSDGHGAVEEVGNQESEMQHLVDGIKAGRLKSKSSDGYLVLKGEFYDAIAAGEKKVEYRDFTEYNLKRTIGLKTIRFNRGYVKNAPQMKWEVKKVVLLDGDDNECDPFNVPDGFWPTAIAIHLGKRFNSDWSDSIVNADESKLPWYGRKDLIMSNKEYWEEVNRVAPPSKEEQEESDWGDLSEEEFEKAVNRYFSRINSKPTEKVFERRQLGAMKAEYEWHKGGCKGEPPEDVSDIYMESLNPFMLDSIKK